MYYIYYVYIIVFGKTACAVFESRLHDCIIIPGPFNLLRPLSSGCFIYPLRCNMPYRIAGFEVYTEYTSLLIKSRLTIYVLPELNTAVNQYAHLFL